MTTKDFSTLVENTIAKVNYRFQNMDTEKYAAALYEDYNMAKKDDATAMRIYSEQIAARVYREWQLVADYQEAARKFNKYGMNMFVR